MNYTKDKSILRHAIKLGYKTVAEFALLIKARRAICH